MPPSSILRVPQEADPSRFPLVKQGVEIPPPIDFATATPAQIKASIAQSIPLGVALTNVYSEKEGNGIAQYFTPAGEERVTVQVADGESFDLTVQMEHVAIAGSPYKELVGIRHICKLPIAPDYFLDCMSRLTYTNAIDKFCHYAKALQLVETDNPDDIAWCHVSYMADTIVAPVLFATREFVTLDFLSQSHGLTVGRSCLHPDQPKTQDPDWNCFLWKQRRYQCPLLHCGRVLPDPDGDPNACIHVQFQYSDIGGVIPIPSQIQAVQDFGVESIPKLFQIAKKAQAKGIPLGKGSEGYLEDPLHPVWIQDMYEMIPGLKD